MFGLFGHLCIYEYGPQISCGVSVCVFVCVFSVKDNSSSVKWSSEIGFKFNCVGSEFVYFLYHEGKKQYILF